MTSRERVRSGCAACRGRHVLSLLVGIAVLLTALSGGAVAEEPHDVLLSALTDLGLAEPELIADALALGIDQERLTLETMMRLLDLLAAAPDTTEHKEALLLVLASTLEDELPAEGLVDKAIQGLTRGVPLVHISREIETRRRLELSVRDLLHAHGIFSAAGEARTALHHLPRSSFDGLVTHIAGALGDALEAGGSPFDGVGLHAAVRHRLTQLAGAVLLAQDVDLVLERIGPEDWTEAVLAALG